MQLNVAARNEAQQSVTLWACLITSVWQVWSMRRWQALLYGIMLASAAARSGVQWPC